MFDFGSGRRRIAALLTTTCAVALASAAAAPSAGADTVSIDEFGLPAEYDMFINDTSAHFGTQKIRFRLSNNDIGNDVAPGSAVRLTPSPVADPGLTPNPAGATINVPADWSEGMSVTGEATVAWDAAPVLSSRSINVVYTVAGTCSGAGGCLPSFVTRSFHLTSRPQPVTSFVVVADGNDVVLNWGLSPDDYRLTRYSTAYSRREGPRHDGNDPVARGSTSYRYSNFPPDAKYCFNLSASVQYAPFGFVSTSNGTEQCVLTNRSPRGLGAPAGPAGGVDADGAYTVAWAAANDLDGDAITYTLQHRDNDSDWSNVASGFDALSHPVAETEGTWRYRVRATDEHGVAGPWVESTPVVVDETAPVAHATTNPPDPVVDDWFAGSVEISFASSADPRLLDGSPGSGVFSYTDALTLDADGTHTGTATDRAGNVSAPVTRAVRVDATNPTAEIDCPTERVLLNSTASVEWRLTDEGSGIDGPTTDTVDLNTASAGPKTVSSPVPTDLVGHVGEAAECKYTVNSPPGNPGAPKGVDFSKPGNVDIEWGASVDPDADENNIAYVLQKRDENDADWSNAGAGADRGVSVELIEEGTYRFQVQATDSHGARSEWVESTTPVVIDDGRPSAPTASTDRPGVDGWFRGDVTVSWGGSTDPGLTDGSDGSGVDDETGYSPDEEVVTGEGSHTALGIATDRSGNVSGEGSTTFRIDNTPPTTTIKCPSGPIVAGADAVATWTAEDGGSGLATDASGSVALDTETAGGPRTATTLAPVDRVENVGDADSCSYTVVPPNRPPAAPGSPSGPELDRDGAVELSWALATDPDDGDTISYVVEQRDADDAGWSSAGDPVGEPRLNAALSDGTWQFRVKAVDGDGAESPWSDPSSEVKVDRVAPDAPTVTTDPATPFVGDWFKDSVVVSFASSGDPDLSDGSDGSGLKSVTAPVTVRADGETTLTGIATDNVDNSSEPTRKTVKVDRSAPTTTIACPSQPLIVGQPGQTARWTASDGQSGLASAAGGSVALNTATAGRKTAVAPAATDRVGHENKGDSCEYEVRYRFLGSLPPVEGGNVVNVGRGGRAFPVKWRLERWNGSSISDAEGIALAQQMSASDDRVACSSYLSAPEDRIEEAADTGGAALKYDTRANQFIYRYKSPSYGCYVLSIRRADGLNTRQWRFFLL